MERDSRAYLWDVREAAEAKMEFTASNSLQDYLDDRMSRSAYDVHERYPLERKAGRT